ncbi:MAG: glycosyltransferase [Lachnospiraceae bacterium]|nr:glycosyltransferase [Lachnospiraceae bacterium]
MKEPLISIIVPIFNVEKYVSECIESIIRQNHENLQIILVDDGSTDMSGEICDKYALSDRRIEVIHSRNRGLVLARKSGLEKAAGDYIGFVDGDDYIAPEMFGELLKGVKKHNADFVHSGFIADGKRIINFKGGVIKFNNHKDREDFIRTSVFYSPSHIAPSIWSKLFKAEFIKECYSKVPDDAQYGEDLINLCVCIENCSKLVLLDEAYYYYRQREESITHKFDLNSFKNVFRYYVNVCNAVEGYGCYDELEELLTEEVCNNIMHKIKVIAGNDFQMARYCYAQPDELQGKRIVIYGAGAVGRDYYAQISRYTNCNIVAWVDAQPERYDYSYVKLYGTEVLEQIVFDILIIAVSSERLANEIKEQLVQKGVDESRMVWREAKPYKLEMLND